jgi:hypothetical protein
MACSKRFLVSGFWFLVENRRIVGFFMGSGGTEGHEERL